MFADDTTILWTNQSKEDLHGTICSDLDVLGNWCKANHLVLNASKTNILSFKCRLPACSLNSEPLEVQGVHKFLGIYMDESLRFSEHITETARKVARGCYAVRVVAGELGEGVSRDVYYALVESQLRYGICFWGSCSETLFQTLFILQKKAIRFMCGSGRFQSCRPLFLTRKILTLTCLFILETCCLVHSKFRDAITAENTNSTRSTHLVPLPIPRSALTKRSLIYTSGKIFNHLPSGIRRIRCVKKFKGKSKNCC